MTRNPDRDIHVITIAALSLSALIEVIAML